MPGLLELCALLDSCGVPRGLITRNVLSSVAFFHQHHLPLPPFVPAISRECQVGAATLDALLRAALHELRFIGVTIQLQRTAYACVCMCVRACACVRDR